MSCPLNKQKFLWFNYEGNHDYRLQRVSKFMSSSDDFVIHYKCSICKCTYDRHFVQTEDLLRLGYNHEQITAYHQIVP